MALQQHAVAVAYFDLTRAADWNAIVQAGSKVRFVVPDGSFRTLADPAAATRQFQACQQAGQLVLGYVFTGNGNRDIKTVNDEVDGWATEYGTAVDGFYFDSDILLGPGQGTTDQQYQDYYRPLIAGVRSRYPGRKIGIAASQYKYQWVIEVADFATIWEKPATDYLSPNNYVAGGEHGSEAPPDWWTENPGKVVVTVTGTSQEQAAQVLAASRDRNVGNLYIHDDHSTPVSYGHLSKWWNTELTGLAGWPWELTGNSGTDPAINFLGTTDRRPLVIRTNNLEALRVGEDGRLLVRALVDGGGIVLVGSAVPTAGDVGIMFGDNVDPTIKAEVGFSNAVNAWMTGTQPGDIGLFANPGRVRLGTGPDTAMPQLMICNPDNSPDSFRPGLWLGDSAISFATSTNDGTGEFIRSNRPSGTPNSIGLDFYTGYVPRLSITNGGDVGIGTQEPSTKLDVAGDIRVQGNVLSGSADCAEDFEADEAELIEPGTVMVMDSSGRLRPSSRAYDSRVTGVVSGGDGLRPAIRLNHQASTEGNRVPIALLGRVMCKVEAESEPIGTGDLLTTSDTFGHAMKAKDPSRGFGTIIGKAMGPAVGGRSLIPILVALQ